MHDLKEYLDRMLKTAEDMTPSGIQHDEHGDVSVDTRDQDLQALFANLSKASQADQALMSLLFSSSNLHTRAGTLRKVAAFYGIKTADLSDEQLMKHFADSGLEMSSGISPATLRRVYAQRAADHGHADIASYLRTERQGRTLGQRQGAAIQAPTARAQDAVHGQDLERQFGHLSQTAPDMAQAVQARAAATGIPAPAAYGLMSHSPKDMQSLMSAPGAATPPPSPAVAGTIRAPKPLPPASMPAGVPAMNAPGHLPVPGSPTANNALNKVRAAAPSLEASTANVLGKMKRLAQSPVGKIIHASVSEQLSGFTF